MKKLLALLIIPLLNACEVAVDSYGGGHGGHGGPVTESRNLPSFRSIEVESPVHVIIRGGSRYAAYVTVDEDLTGYFETEVSNGVLSISQTSSVYASEDPYIVVTVPELRGVSNDSYGLVEISEDGNFPNLELELNGGGDLRFSGTASTLTANLFGGGRIILEGYAYMLKANLNGHGEIDGANFLSGDADVNLAGSGDVFLDLDYESVLNLYHGGSGKLEWWGAPARLNYTLAGSGKVIEHRGIPKRGVKAPAPKRGVPAAPAAPSPAPAPQA